MKSHIQTFGLVLLRWSSTSQRYGY